MSGIAANKEVGLVFEKMAAEVVSLTVKKVLNPILDELKQLSGVTGSTSAGSAKVMSTHWKTISYRVFVLVVVTRAYTVEGGAVLGRLDHLNGGIVSDLCCKVGGKRNLGQTETAVELVVAWSRNLKSGNHVQGEIAWHRVLTEVDVEESKGMSWKPARLHSNGSTVDRPFSTVRCQRHSAT